MRRAGPAGGLDGAGAAPDQNRRFTILLIRVATRARTRSCAYAGLYTSPPSPGLRASTLGNTMLQLDDQFLADCGLESLSNHDKQSLLQAIHLEIELRVGEALSEGMSDAQLDTFGAIVDRDEEIIRSWLAMHVPDYLSDELYQRIEDGAPDDVGELDLLSEYASMAWLSANRPDYSQIVQAEFERLKAELTARRDELLG